MLNGIFSQPIVCGQIHNCQLSISHTDEICGAVCFDEAFPMGLDLKKKEASNLEIINKQLTEKEKSYLHYGPDIPFVLWTAKESLGKALRTGLTVPLHLLEINKIILKNTIFHIDYTHFCQ